MDHLCLSDATFGPVVASGCRGGFDFTLTFENTILSIVPSALFVGAAALRILSLFSRDPVVTNAPWIAWAAKQLLIAIFVGLGLAHVVWTALNHDGGSSTAPSSTTVYDTALAAAVLQLVSGLCMAPLSALEHARSHRPAIVLTVYLSLSILLDAAQVRTAWLLGAGDYSYPRGRAGQSIMTAMLASKLTVLAAESLDKSSWLPVRSDGQDRSSEETSGILGLGLFIWLNKLLLRGYANAMTISSLYLLDGAMSSQLLHGQLDIRLSLLQSQPPRDHRWGLASGLAKTLAWPLLILPIVPRLVKSGFTFSQPFFISALVSFLGRSSSSPDAPHSADQAKGLIGAAALVYLGIALSSSLYRYLVYRGLYMARGCLVAAIYSKTTTQPLAVAKHEKGNGNDDNDDEKGDDSDSTAAVTLMSTDVERIVVGLVDLHEIWACPMEIAISCWMLYRQLGLAFLSPLVIVLLCLVVMAWVGKTTLKKQTAWVERIQTRVSTTAMAIRHFKALKIAALDPAIGSLVRHQRIKDLQLGSRFRLLQVMAAVVAFVPQCLSPVFAFTFANRNLDVDAMFSSLSFLVLLTTPLAIFFQSIPLILASLACISRIQSFLSAPHRHDLRACVSSSSTDLLAPLSPGSKASDGLSRETRQPSSEEEKNSDLALLSIANGQFGWDDRGKPTLKDVNLTIATGSLSVVMGPMASGKSTLCKAILGETPVNHGIIEIHPSIASSTAFCDQDPVVFAGTVRDNIIRYTSFHDERYRDVLFATNLNPDIQGLAQGDRTVLKGGSDAALSGGQKARLALARALYVESRLVVVDDALSSLDNKTERLVFERTFGPDGLLRRRGSAVLFCTHSPRHVDYADQVITLTNAGHVKVEALRDYRDKKQTNILDETSSGVSSSKDPQSGLPTVAVPAVDDEHGSGISDNRGDGEDSGDDRILDALLDRRSREQSEMGVYKYYLGSMPALYLGFLFLSAVAFGFGLNFPTVWVSIWSSDSLHRDTGFYLGLYALMRTLQLVGVAASASVVLVIMVRASGIELHDATLATTLNAPLSVLTALSPGKVINLFSQDITIIDSELPISFLNLSVGTFGMVGMAVVIAASSPWIVLSYPLLGALIWALQGFYLRTSKQLRLLDLEAKSPLYAHFLDTIHALPTIRAYGWARHELSRAYQLLDTSQRPAYLLAMAQQWLILALDLMVAGMVVLLTALSTQLSSDSGLAGASMVTLMSLGEMVAGLVRSYTQLETSIGAVGRLLTFTRTVPSESQNDDDDDRDNGQEGEGHGPDINLEPTWPTRGQIDLRNVSAMYRTGLPSDSEDAENPQVTAPLALDNISLSIAAGEKVTVCGRTGSGKSSLLLFLLRLLGPVVVAAERCDGDGLAAEIDGVALNRIRRSVLRQRIIAVPQDCVFLPEGSSIRANLDIRTTNSTEDDDDQLYIDVLREVRLDAFVADQGGLSGLFRVDRLSAGQRQMFSLARAMLRQRQRQRQAACGEGGDGDGGILLLDEMGSHVDAETERLVYHLIRSHFAAYTVVMVAHRLEFLVDWVDKVVVLDKGHVVEVGNPTELQKMSPHGWFAQLMAGTTTTTTATVSHE